MTTSSRSTEPNELGAEPAGPPSAIDRAVGLLTIIANSAEPLSLAQTAAKANLSKPTTHRILHVLMERGLLRQDANRLYLLGPAAYSLASATLSHLELSREAQTGMEWLKSYVPDTIHLASLSNDVVMYVAKIEGTRPYRMASTIGGQLPLHSTAIGKSVLAFSTPEKLAALMPQEFPIRTPRTISNRNQLLGQLEEIRERGYAIDDEENEENIRCVGAPVFGPANEVVGGVSVSTPSIYLDLNQAHSLAPRVMEAAAMISRAIGGSPPSPRA